MTYSSETSSSTIPTTFGSLVEEKDFINTSAIEEQCPELSTGRQSLFLFYSVFSVVFFLGLVGNGLLILIFIRHKTVRSAPNTYILNLAVTDMLVTLNCASAPLADSAGHTYPIVCTLYQLVMETTHGVTAISLTALSIERYYAIVHPFSKTVSSRSFTLRVVVIIWFVALTYVCAKMFFMPASKCPGCVQMFNPTSFARTYIITDFFLLYLIPMTIITILYILMAHALYFSDSTLTPESASDIGALKRLQAKKRIAITVLVLVLMFLIFYLPYNIMSLKLYSTPEYRQRQQWNKFTRMLFCVGCLHNAFNPFILYFLSESFRNHFNNYLFCNVLRHLKNFDSKDSYPRTSKDKVTTVSPPMSTF